MFGSLPLAWMLSHLLTSKPCDYVATLRPGLCSGQNTLVRLHNRLGTSIQRSWCREQESKSRLLSEALRTRLAEVNPHDPAGRTFAEAIAENLVRIACSQGPSAVHAANEIADRIEGRSRQSIEVADITAEIRNKSDEELRVHLENDRWPSDEERMSLMTGQAGPVE